MVIMMMLVLMALACGNEPRVVEIPFDATDTPERILEEYLYAWVSENPNNTPINTPIGFADLDPGVLGVCITWRSLTNPNDPRKEIQIDREGFTEKIKSGGPAAKTIVFHELAHCELDRDHTEDFMVGADGERIPFSIMYPSLWPDESIYTRYYGHYMDELFGGRGFNQRIPRRSVVDDDHIMFEDGGWVGVGVM